MRILKHGREQLYAGNCDLCGCEFECQLTDGAIPKANGWQICCPECRKLVPLRAKTQNEQLKLVGGQSCENGSFGRDRLPAWPLALLSSLGPDLPPPT